MAINLMHLVPKQGTMPPALPLTPGSRPVVFLHGSLSSSGTLRFPARAVQAHGVPAIGIDYGSRGVGDVHASQDTVARHLRSMLLTADQVDIVGHSLGGFIGLQVACREEFHGRINTLVGLGAAFKGDVSAVPAPMALAFKYLFGPAHQQLNEHTYQPQKIPDTLRVVSIVSDRDTIVPPAMSDVGEVRWVTGVSHAALARLSTEVLDALGREEFTTPR